jgi:hypothetical protein
VTSARRIELAERKALLAVRSELDRVRVLLAVREIKAVVAPGSEADRAARYRPVATMLVSILGPSVGASRFGRWLRVAGIALAALRIARSWK